MKFYVYLLFDGDVPFYVGKGSGTRMYNHYKQATQTNKRHPVLDKIRQMLRADKKIRYEKIFESDDSAEAYLIEIKTISSIGRRNLGTGPLLNLTDGGEGVVNYKWTSEHKKNLSASIKLAIEEGRFIINGTRSCKNETKRKLSIAIKNFYETSAGQLRKMELSVEKTGKKRILSDEARRKMSLGGKRKTDEETRKKLSQSAKESWKKRKTS